MSRGELALPKSTCLEIPAEERAQMLAALRRARYGYLLALHLGLWCAAGRTPTAIAAVRLCSRSRVYRTVRAYREGTLGWEHDDQGRLVSPRRTTVRLPTLRRSLLAMLQVPPRTSGWCRTRGSGATLALTRQAKRGLTGSAETRRRGRHEIGGVWKPATWVAQDADPPRLDRLARLRWVDEQLQLWEAMVLADERDRPLRPKVGSAGMPQGTQVEVMTPGQHAKYDLAGALDLATGPRRHRLEARNTTALCRDLLPRLHER